MLLDSSSSAANGGWLLVLTSSMACIAGASLVFLNKRILDNKRFISASLALGGGVLLFNSLYILLPASQQNFDSNILTFACFFIGVFWTICLSYIVEWCTPHAIHTCDPTTAAPVSRLEEGREDSTLLAKKQHKHHQNYDTDAHRKSKHHQHVLEYGSVAVDDSPMKDKNDFLSIGIQTAVAICVHKFPEGLVMFISNEASTQLGLKVTAAMTIHNFVEGFLISLPLFHATSSRSAAFFYASLLGGLSQPLGAVLGLFTITEMNELYNKYLFGITFAVVSGMLCYIAIQSMIPQAVKAHQHSQRYVTLFFFLGISLIGLSNIIQSS